MSRRIPTVGVVIIHEDKVLLVEHQEGAGHLTGSYGFPGGKVDPGEPLIQAAIREAKEETGLIVKEEDLVKLPNIYETDLQRKSGNILYVTYTVYATDKFDGELQSSHETIPEWVKVEKLLDLPDLLPNTENAIKEALKILGK